MDLVVLAGGMGSRFGGLKQIEPIDKDGNFIIDYSIYDAISAGFDRVIFVIKKENLLDFKNTIGSRLENKIKVEYVFQDLNKFVPKNKNYDFSSRIKPWGTAHAILCCKEKVKDNFAIINADDFYGRNSYKLIYDFLKNISSKKDYNTSNYIDKESSFKKINSSSLENNKTSFNDNLTEPISSAMVAYKVYNTLSENGEVKRGICNIEDGNLKGFSESVIKSVENKIYSKPVDTENPFKEISKNCLVSMNLFGFCYEIFTYLEKGFIEFLEKNKDNLQTCEYYIPNILTDCLNNKKISLKVLETNEKWFGLTYKEDYNKVVEEIQNKKIKGIYPNSLWKD